MKVSFSITESSRRRYKQFLIEDWSRETLVALRDFLLKQFEAAGLELVFTDERDEILDEEPKVYRILPSASEELREHLQSLNYDLASLRVLRALAVGRYLGDSRVERQKRKEFKLRTAAERRHHELVMSVAFLLAFPAWPLRQNPAGEAIRPIVSGDIGLFDDTRSILYLCAAHELLPELESKKRQDLLELLLQALYTHAKVVWVKYPAHQHYLFSVFFDSIGDQERASQALLRSFESTPPTEHDFMTRAFNYWSYEVDRKRIDSATAFALRLHRDVRSELVTNAEDLVRQSFKLQAARGGQPSPKRRAS